jgi:hypothetical protein
MHHVDLSSALTAQQVQVISLLSHGGTINDAAATVGVSCHTIRNRRCAIPAFAIELDHASREQALAWQEELRGAVPLATQSINTILSDPAASPALRLRAAGMILELADLPGLAECASFEKTWNSAQSCTMGSFRKMPAPGISAHDFSTIAGTPLQNCTTANCAQFCTIRRPAQRS